MIGLDRDDPDPDSGRRLAVDLIWLAVIVLASILFVAAVSALLLSCVDGSVGAGDARVQDSSITARRSTRSRAELARFTVAGVNRVPPCTNTTAPAMPSCRQAP